MKRLFEQLALVAFPKALMELGCNYFRVEVEGLENVPQTGRGLVIPNHSTWSGLDALILSHVLRKNLNRYPKILTLWNLIEAFSWLKPLAQRMGLRKASAKTGLELLQNNHLTILFPEGVSGSFKPSSQRYKLQEFHTGYARMALLSKSPVIPCIIIGAEEAQINLGNIQISNILQGLSLPIPFNVVPFPAKWKIRFLPQLNFSGYVAEDTNSKNLMKNLANKTRKIMQSAINQELGKRKYVFFQPSPTLSLPSGLS